MVSDIFLILALISIVCSTVFTVLIVSFISKRGIKINFFLLRIFIIKYVNQYKQITIQENGQPGKLYYGFLVTIGLTVVFAIIGIILKNYY